jgi:hypothetical protein
VVMESELLHMARTLHLLVQIKSSSGTTSSLVRCYGRSGRTFGTGICNFDFHLIDGRSCSQVHNQQLWAQTLLIIVSLRYSPPLLVPL